MSLHRYCFFECALAQTHSKKQYPLNSSVVLFHRAVLVDHTPNVALMVEFALSVSAVVSVFICPNTTLMLGTAVR